MATRLLCGIFPFIQLRFICFDSLNEPEGGHWPGSHHIVSTLDQTALGQHFDQVFGATDRDPKTLLKTRLLYPPRSAEERHGVAIEESERLQAGCAIISPSDSKSVLIVPDAKEVNSAEAGVELAEDSNPLS